MKTYQVELGECSVCGGFGYTLIPAHMSHDPLVLDGAATMESTCECVALVARHMEENGFQIEYVGRDEGKASLPKQLREDEGWRVMLPDGRMLNSNRESGLWTSLHAAVRAARPWSR